MHQQYNCALSLAKGSTKPPCTPADTVEAVHVTVHMTMYNTSPALYSHIFRINLIQTLNFYWLKKVQNMCGDMVQKPLQKMGYKTYVVAKSSNIQNISHETVEN